MIIKINRPSTSVNATFSNSVATTDSPLIFFMSSMSSCGVWSVHAFPGFMAKQSIYRLIVPSTSVNATSSDSIANATHL